ncbi:MAG: hypothetical protein HQM07_08560 [Zetaproteobacteria bacterium]|nr:hypothetical protein [Zetaproteobacteria bacterium]
MQSSFDVAWFGMMFTAGLYLLGNMVWVNRWVRMHMWFGWLFWILAAGTVLFIAAQIEVVLGVAAGLSVWQKISSEVFENHWIIVGLFALLSVPGASSIIFKLDRRLTLYAVLLPALILFIPMGRQLAHDVANAMYWGVGIAGGVCFLLVLWLRYIDVGYQSLAVEE